MSSEVSTSDRRTLWLIAVVFIATLLIVGYIAGFARAHNNEPVFTINGQALTEAQYRDHVQGQLSQNPASGVLFCLQIASVSTEEAMVRISAMADNDEGEYGDAGDQFRLDAEVTEIVQSECREFLDTTAGASND